MVNLKISTILLCIAYSVALTSKWLPNLGPIDMLSSGFWAVIFFFGLWLADMLPIP
jgi:hypothetical protein